MNLPRGPAIRRRIPGGGYSSLMGRRARGVAKPRTLVVAGAVYSPLARTACVDRLHEDFLHCAMQPKLDELLNRPRIIGGLRQQRAMHAIGSQPQTARVFQRRHPLWDGGCERFHSPNSSARCSARSSTARAWACKGAERGTAQTASRRRRADPDAASDTTARRWR